MMLVNGQQTETLNALDRGLQYGDGLFETIAVANGTPRYWHRHMQRLSNGCARLGIAMADQQILAAEVEELCREENRCVIKIIVTRGTGGRGYRPLPSAQHSGNTGSRIIIKYRWQEYPQDYYQNGIRLRLCETRLGNNSSLAGMKHLNRLEQVLARSEWDDDTAEGLMLGADGFVIEGTMSNIFAVVDQRLITPDLSECGVKGIMRGVVCETAESLNIPLTVEKISLDRIRNADELFVTNSLIGIWPVREFAEIHFRHWPLTTRITEALRTVAE